MAPEVADSDDESEIIPPSRPLNLPAVKSPKIDPSTSTEEGDPVLDLCFDQFLSPTQQLSSLDGQQEIPDGTTSTDRFLSEVAPVHGSSSQLATVMNDVNKAVSLKNGLKRAYSQCEAETKSRDDLCQGTKKRSKTYGRLPSHRDDGSRMLFANTDEPGVTAGEEQTLFVSPAEVKHIPRNNIISEQVTTGGFENKAPSLIRSRINGMFGVDIQHATTMRSSLGSYQSINIDFSGTDTGFDFNPFGTLSQVSLDGEVNAETERVVNLFRNASNRPAEITESRRNKDVDNASLLEQGKLSTQESDGGGKGSTMPNIPAPSDIKAPSCSPLTERDYAMLETDQDGTVPPTTKNGTQQTSSNKRGRRSKAVANIENMPSIEQIHVDEVHTDGIQSPRRSRADTLDSTSNISEISEATSNAGTRKRKRKATVTIKSTRSISKKEHPSDLGLNDPNVIGLPAEQYVPRPSRRRAQLISDKLAESVDQGANTDVSQQSVQRQCQTSVDELPKQQMEPPKGKKSKKSKVQRAKTPVPTSPKSCQQMLDENKREETKEFICVDEEPVEDKCKGLQELSQSKLTKPEEVENIKPCQEDSAQFKPTSVKSISINVPRLEISAQTPKSLPSVTTSKRRGRKGNKLIKVSEDPQSEQKPAEEEETNGDGATSFQRPPLASTDANVDPSPSREYAKETGCAELPSPPNEDLSHACESLSPTKSTYSPLKGCVSTSVSPFSTTYRIGLSRRHFIPSLLRKIDRSREPPKVTEKKEKLTKKQMEQREKEKLEREDEEITSGASRDDVRDRGTDGYLIEWDD